MKPIEIKILCFQSPSIKKSVCNSCISHATLHTWIHNLRKSGDISKVDATGNKDMAFLIEENRRLHKGIGYC